MIHSRNSTCLATVTDEVYLPGTVVMLASFLHHNAWFRGTIVIIHDGLAPESRRRLSEFPNVVFHSVGDRLKRRLAATALAVPAVERKRSILYALEAFGLSQYERVLKIDSDVLCTGSAAALVENDAPLLACPDQSFFRGQRRDTGTYTAAVEGDTATGTREITFNAGVLSIAPLRLGPSTYSDLVDLVQPATWSTVLTGHTDSVVLNRYFKGRWTMARETCNYLIAHDMSRYIRPRAPLADAALVHFLGQPKPWQVDPATLGAMDEARRIPFALWLTARAAYAASK